MTRASIWGNAPRSANHARGTRPSRSHWPTGTAIPVRLCSYVVVHDNGFAPNPFGGLCTLAACTPNHQGVRLCPGDWILGNSSLATASRLIYAMRIRQVLDFDEYYRDPRFAAKKARPGTWQERCGDNIYFRDPGGRWAQARAYFHTRPVDLKKDTRHPRVFISNHFFYFGENAPSVPCRYLGLMRKRQGCCCSHDPATIQSFIGWLERTYHIGRHGNPRDPSGHAGVGSSGKRPASAGPTSRAGSGARAGSVPVGQSEAGAQKCERPRRRGGGQLA
jgi:hypothetical protein